MSLGWRALVRAEATMARRRRRGVAFHPAAQAIGGGALAGAALFSLPEGDARAWWLLATLAAAAIIVMAGPFRMFWRSDASLLGRLPIEGKELYRLATVRSLRMAAWLGLALAVAAAPHVPEAPLVWVRLVGIGAALLAGAGLASPAITTSAGAIIVSAKAQELMKELASGQVAPGIVWLSLLPAAGGLGIAWAGFTGTPIALAVVVAACVVAHLAAARGLATTLATATREIAALDAVKLAHVDLVGARGLEKLWGRLTAGAGRSVYEKDVAIARRRHPGYYLLTGLGILALWIVAAAVAVPARDHIAAAGLGALLAYALLHARRLTVPPIERPRLLQTLPLSHATIGRAKAAHVAWRVVWVCVVGGAPAVARAGEPAVLGGLIAGLAVATILVGALLSRPRL